MLILSFRTVYFGSQLKISDKQQANPSSQQEYINKILTLYLKEKKTRPTGRKGNKRHLGGGIARRTQHISHSCIGLE